MKKMHITSEPKTKKQNVVVKFGDLRLRNELHFQACLANNCYVAKNKKRIIPRKQKYKNFD